MNAKSEVEQFLKLQAMNLVQLQELCTKVSITTDGASEDLIDRLMGYQAQVETPPILPQALPLRTIGDNGEQMFEAIETIKRWRKLIYETQGNQREFQLVNSQGKQYKARLRYIRCSVETLKAVLERRWYFAHPSQQPLVDALRNQPHDFEVNIVQKPSGKGNSWIMVHATPKAA